MNKLEMNKIKELEKKIESEQNFNTTEIKNYMDEIYFLKKQNIENEKNITILNNLENYLQFKKQEITAYKQHIFTLITTIFLPLSFITGFFGMNFRSMGVPSLQKGILTIQNADYFVFILSVVSVIVVAFIFFYLDTY